MTEYPKNVDTELYPYYQQVPKDLKSNLAWRGEWVRRGAASKQAASQIWTMCSKDMLFYINTFCWIFEPRTPARLPFNTYPFQDEALRVIQKSIGNNDLIIEKSRDMGASWMCLTTMEWFWHFHGMYTFLLLSRKEELVDKRGDPKALFQKIDFLHEWQPGWLLPMRVERMKLHNRNCENGATLDGESTNKFAGVADRRTAMFVDEYSKMDNQDVISTGTRDVTKCRIFLFTPQGAANMAYRMAHNPQFPKLTLHWSKHPIKNLGLYRVSKTGVVEVLDEEWHKDSPGYAFVKTAGNWDGLRSPWYDAECPRAGDPREIAQELDLDYEGSGGQFFDPTMLDRVTKDHCQIPYYTGDFSYDPVSLRPTGFTEVHGGKTDLWMQLDEKGDPPKADYVLAADVAQGTGASFSPLVGYDKKLKQKVFRFTSDQIDPKDFGQMAVAVAHWLKSEGGSGAELIWEKNGPGASFGNAVIEGGYRHVYFYGSENHFTGKRSEKPGWQSTTESKKTLLEEYRWALNHDAIINRSIESIDEARLFVYRGNAIIHARSVDGSNVSALADNHGDECIADALAYKLLSSKTIRTKTETPLPLNCLTRRRQERDQARSEQECW